MERSRLERASWIAGIVSAIVAVVALIASSKSGKVSPDMKAPEARQSVSKSEVSIPNSEPPISTPMLQCGTNETIAEGIKVVETISSPIVRDSAYGKLIDSALCIENIALAGGIAARVSSPFARDSQYGKIVEKAAAFEKPQEALTFTDKISSPFARDSAKRKLVEALNQKRS